MTPADLDALVARLQGLNPPDRTIASQRDYSQAIHDAADALAQLRDSEALARSKIAEQMIEIERLKANQRCSAIEQGDVGYPCVFRAEAEAEVARLKDRLEAQFKRLTSMDGLLDNAEAEVARLTKQASAVVVIMPPREPTQEMDDAASNVDRSNLPGIFRRQVWRAMWDASGVAKDSVITGNEP